MLIESENEFEGSATKNGIEIMKSFKASSMLILKNPTESKIKIRYENSCGINPITIAKTMITSNIKIVLRDIDIF